MSKQPIPDSALDDRLGFTGTSGSGKTYTAMGRVERLLDKAARVCVIDPLGVWWGLRVEHDRKTPSRFATAPEGSAKRVVIFGGTHGDLPLTEHSGKLVGETVAGMAESCIIDLSEIGTAAGERRFLLAFLTALYRKTSKEPRHLVIDEADMFAPQKVLDKEGDANKLLGMMQTVVRRGRVKGFIPWLITQRPAEISKGVLSQVDGLSIGKLTASQDIAAIGLWVKATADEGVWEKTKGELPSYGTGQSMVWIPGRNIIGTYQFPEKSTFDSSRAPKRGETIKQTNLKPLDLGKLQQLLATVEAEVKSNDPKALKEELAKTKRELAAAQKKTAPAAAPVVDHAAMKRAVQDGYNIAVGEFSEMIGGHIAAVLDSAVMLPQLTARLDALQKAANKFATSTATKPTLKSASPQGIQAPAKAPILRNDRPAPAARGDGSLEQRILNAMAELLALGVPHPSREIVAMMVGYQNPKSGGYTAALGVLTGSGKVSIPGSGNLALTETGLASAVADATPLSTDAMQRRIVAILGTPADKILAHLIEIYPNPIDRADLAAQVGCQNPKSGGFTAAIGKLSTLGFIGIPAAGQVSAKEILFP